MDWLFFLAVTIVFGDKSSKMKFHSMFKVHISHINFSFSNYELTSDFFTKVHIIEKRNRLNKIRFSILNWEMIVEIGRREYVPTFRYTGQKCKLYWLQTITQCFFYLPLTLFYHFIIGELVALFVVLTFYFGHSFTQLHFVGF